MDKNGAKSRKIIKMTHFYNRVWGGAPSSIFHFSFFISHFTLFHTLVSVPFSHIFPHEA